MSLHHNPRIVTDGLVFGYDMDNTAKSFKGKPTTNLIETNLTSFTKDNGCTVTATGEYFQGSPVYRVVFNSGTLPRIRTNFAYTAQQYSGSIYYKVVVQGSHSPSLYFREINFGTNYTSTLLNSTTWAKANINHTFSASGTVMFLLYQSSSNSTSDTVIDFAMPQAEVGSFSTPFVNGTRSNTQALLDMSKSRNTITATSLTYNSDGTFEFDNLSSNYVDLPNDIGVTGNNVSAFAWFKRNGSPSEGYHIICGGQQLEISIPDPNGALRVGVYSGGTRYVSNHGSGLLDGNWHHIGFTSDGTTKTAYIDGESVGTQSISGTLSSSFSNRTLGRFGTSSTYYANANISIYQIYNKTLTAAEIKQNFNATRGRFGI